MLWTTSVNFSRNTNEMISFSDASRGYELEDLRLSPAAGTWSQYVDEGQPVGNYVAPVFDGVDENGDPIYLDVNGDGWKYIEAAVPGRWPETPYDHVSHLEPQLYHLSEDEAETENLFDQMPDKVTELKELIKQAKNKNLKEASL